MSKPKEIVGALYFGTKEPHIIGHLTIGNRHYELVGVRRTNVRTEITGRRVAEKQADLFEGDVSNENAGKSD